MTSTDFCSSIATLLSVFSPVADKQISQGKARDFTPIYPVHIRPVGPDGIGLRVFVPSRPPTSRLVCTSCSSGQEFCLQLPSHPTSRRRSCCSARGSCHQGPQRTSFFSKGGLLVTSRFAFAPRLTAPCLAHKKNGAPTGAPFRVGASRLELTSFQTSNPGQKLKRTPNLRIRGASNDPGIRKLALSSCSDL